MSDETEVSRETRSFYSKRYILFLLLICHYFHSAFRWECFFSVFLFCFICSLNLTVHTVSVQRFFVVPSSARIYDNLCPHCYCIKLSSHCSLALSELTVLCARGRVCHCSLASLLHHKCLFTFVSNWFPFALLLCILLFVRSFVFSYFFGVRLNFCVYYCYSFRIVIFVIVAASSSSLV